MDTKIASYRNENFLLTVTFGEPMVNKDGTLDYSFYDPDFPIWGFIYYLDPKTLEELEVLECFDSPSIDQAISSGLKKLFAEVDKS